jgi:hypothetical protein
LAGPSAIEERPHAIDDGIELGFRDSGEYRKRKRFACESFRDGEVSGAVTKVRVCGGQMNRLWVMTAGSDRPGAQELGKPVGLARADDV